MSDYGGAYIPSKYANVLDENVVIGTATINENTNYQQYASLRRNIQLVI